MAVVAGFGGLRRLTIDHAAVTDAGLVHIGKLPLEELRLTSCFQISDDGLQTVSEFDKLITLSCRDMFFSATGLAAVGHLKRLRTLQLNDLIGLDDTCLDGLIRGTGTPPAAAFSRQGQDRVNESNVPRPARLANLTRLELRGAEITAAGVELVATLGTLEHLNLANCQIDDRGVAHLTTLQNLRTLDLSGNRNISDAAVDRLGRMASLQELRTDGTSISSAAMEQLRAKLPVGP
jgi:Leucine-rich repeat (LRR) protein